MREEGGTPAIVESIRAGLVFQLKEVSPIYCNHVDKLNILCIRKTPFT